MEADPVSRNATNFAIAMGRWAARAASTARISAKLTFTGLLDPGFHVTDGHGLPRVDPGGDGQVDAGVVGQLNDTGQPDQRMLAVHSQLGQADSPLFGERGGRGRLGP